MLHVKIYQKENKLRDGRSFNENTIPFCLDCGNKISTFLIECKLWDFASA